MTDSSQQPAQQTRRVPRHAHMRHDSMRALGDNTKGTQVSNARSQTTRSHTTKAATPAGKTQAGSAAQRSANNRVAARTSAAQSQQIARETQNRFALNKLIYIAGAVVVILIAAILINILSPQETTSNVQNAGTTVSVTIADGSGATDIAKTLYDAHIIDSQEEFLKAVQSQNAQSTMKSGAYSLVAGGSLQNIVQQLVAGPNSTEGKLTVAEGLTVQKTAEVVEQTLGISKDEFIAQAKASNYVTDYPFLQGVQDDSLEGFLFPKTYDFSVKEKSADAVIRAMLSQYQTEMQKLDFTTAKSMLKSKYNQDLSDYDIIKIASIIEKEALNDDDRIKVSSVIYNRLKIGMKLESDATMGYVTGGAVTAADLKTQSPYNTYLNAGLTPTPICNPSLASITAALNPADTNYYYFWITQDEHVFSTTYEEHQKNYS